MEHIFICLSEIQICSGCSANQRQALVWLNHVFSIQLWASQLACSFKHAQGQLWHGRGRMAAVVQHPSSGCCEHNPAHRRAEKLHLAKLKALVLGSHKEFNPWSTSKEDLTKLYQCLSCSTFLSHYLWKAALIRRKCMVCITEISPLAYTDPLICKRWHWQN